MGGMMGDSVSVEIAEGIAIVTLNRPEKGNAMNVALVRELRDCLRRLAEDESVDVVVLTGAGRMFCAGQDMRGFSTAEESVEQVALSLEVYDMLQNLPQPTIAAVNGYAITGGLELVLSCDLRVAAETALFADTHARVGLVPGGGASQKLPRLVGYARAKEMLFTCEFFTAQEALQWGLVNRVVPGDQLLAEARAMAKKIQVQDRTAVRRIKRLVNEGWGRDLEAAMRMERLETQRDMLNSRMQDSAKRRDEVFDRNRGAGAPRE